MISTRTVDSSGAEVAAGSTGAGPCPRAAPETAHLRDAGARDERRTPAARPNGRLDDTAPADRRSGAARCRPRERPEGARRASRRGHMSPRAHAGSVEPPRTPRVAMPPGSSAESWACRLTGAILGSWPVIPSTATSARSASVSPKSSASCARSHAKHRTAPRSTPPRAGAAIDCGAPALRMRASCALKRRRRSLPARRAPANAPSSAFSTTTSSPPCRWSSGRVRRTSPRSATAPCTRAASTTTKDTCFCASRRSRRTAPCSAISPSASGS